MLTPRRFLVSLSLFSLISLSLFPRSLLSILSFCPSPLSFSFFLSLAYLLRLGVKIQRPALWHSCGGDIGGNDVDPAPISGLSFSFLFDLSLSFSSFSPFFSSLFLSLSSISFFLSVTASRRPHGVAVPMISQSSPVRFPAGSKCVLERVVSSFCRF